MTNINIELEDKLHKEAKITSAINGITLKELIHVAIDDYLSTIRDKGYTIDDKKEQTKKKGGSPK